MSDAFTKHILSYGKEGTQWLQSIPAFIAEYEKKWSIRVSPPFPLNYNYVAPATQKDGSDAVLKIGFPGDTEFQTEMEALAIYNGEGCAKLLEIDRERSVVLLERIVPGTPLSDVIDDEKAARIIASVIQNIWKPLPPHHTFLPISKWIRAIPDYKEKYKNFPGPVPMDLVDKAHILFTELIATSEAPILIHGDLHHDNILWSDRDGWRAIDPKGVAAEKAYEAAAMIRNPYERMKSVPNVQNVLRKRIMILSEELRLDPKRIHKWCVAQTVLSAVWNVGTPKGPEHAVYIAEALSSISI